MVDRGELKPVRVGSRRVRIRRTDLDAFLAAGEGPAKSTDELEPLAELLAAAGRHEGRERAAALRGLAAAADALADEIEAAETRTAADHDGR